MSSIRGAYLPQASAALTTKARGTGRGIIPTPPKRPNGSRQPDFGSPTVLRNGAYVYKGKLPTTTVNTSSTVANTTQSVQPNQASEEGTVHFVQCTTNGCDLKSQVLIPKIVNRDFWNRDFLCGFCTAKEIRDVQQQQIELRDEIQHLSVRQQPPQQETNDFCNRSDVNDLLKSIQLEEKQLKEREANLLIFGLNASDATTEKQQAEEALASIAEMGPDQKLQIS